MGRDVFNGELLMLNGELLMLNAELLMVDGWVNRLVPDGPLCPFLQGCIIN